MGLKPFVTVLEQSYLIKLRLLQTIAMDQMIYFAKFKSPLHECPRLKSTNTFKKIFSSFFKLLWSVINSNCHLFTYVCQFMKSVYKEDSR